MPEYLINQLHFITNTEVILKYIKAVHVHDNPPPEFSLNAIKSMPDELFLPLNDDIISLSAMNSELPPLDEATTQAALSNIVFGAPEKSSESEISEKIKKIGDALADGPAGRSEIEAFHRAISNYKQYRYFSQYDWRMAKWGTIEDIHSVTPSTFRPPLTFIEFTTRWTPPIAALQELANTFPSVRFKLKYHFHPDDSWTVLDLFAFPPFGY